MKTAYTPVIGMEVHIELRTLSKMFCGCSADHFNRPPNTLTCPVCLGLPGALPVPNGQAVDWTVLLGLATGAHINPVSKFDRKHYFYPDLPKGYQISQYDEPFCRGGQIETVSGPVRLTRIHLEEDTGKLQHRRLKGRPVTLVDFNRSGVPLVEIVSEPDIGSPLQAKEFAQAVRRLVSFLGISSADMETGSLRLEANISLGLDLGYKVEVKNINSFRFLDQAITYELQRQEKLLAQGITPTQETRGFNEKTHQTEAQRTKEAAADYRYFPEPDIPPIHLSPAKLDQLRRTLPRLPQDYQQEFMHTYAIRPDYAQVLTDYPKLAQKSLRAFQLAQKDNLEPSQVANYLINQKAQAKGQSADQVVASVKQLRPASSVSAPELHRLILSSLKANPDLVTKYRQGKTGVLGVLIGDVVKQSRGQADPRQVKQALVKALP